MSSARILGCLKGIATGDAIGKQTETLARADVVRFYANGIRGFEGEPGTVIPRYAGNRKHEWVVGETSDDTERTIAVARAILRDGDVRHESVGRELLMCRKSVHPGVKSLWEFQQAGNPARMAVDHDGCGAAIGVAPVGILFKSARLERIVKGARDASISTHGGPLALAASAATAAAVSAAIDGAGAEAIIDLAQRAARLAESERTGSDETLFAPAMRVIYDDLRRWPELTPDRIAALYFPNDPLTIVPLAIALATVMESAQATTLLAANVGGDSDSVASIAGGILGARFPDSVNEGWYRVVERINDHRLEPVASALGLLRS